MNKILDASPSSNPKGRKNKIIRSRMLSSAVTIIVPVSFFTLFVRG
jgi:hypothetical protein